MNSLLTAYREAGASADFFEKGSVEFKDAVDAVKERFSEGCLNTAQAVEDRCIHVDKVAAFIASYMKDSKTTVPADLYDLPARPTWSSTFWGASKAKPVVVEPSVTVAAGMAPEPATGPSI